MAEPRVPVRELRHRLIDPGLIKDVTVGDEEVERADIRRVKGDRAEAGDREARAVEPRSGR